MRRPGRLAAALLALAVLGANADDAPRRLYELAEDSAVLVPRRLSDLSGRIDAGTHLVLVQFYSSGDERSARLAPHFAHVARALRPLVVFAAVDVRRRRRLAEEIAQRCEETERPKDRTHTIARYPEHAPRHTRVCV